MQGLVHVFEAPPEPQPMAQKLPGRVHCSLAVHGVAMSQQKSLSQQANTPPTARAHPHCPVAS